MLLDCRTGDGGLWTDRYRNDRGNIDFCNCGRLDDACGCRHTEVVTHTVRD
ncbi:hypothetical protein HanIR_Chr05g0213681 [Helianthus annuus]|nr:hypothetical protein HanIR_Chr05g0213681 [Helianthus annuus]